MTAKEAINRISVMLGVAQDGETADTQDVSLKATAMLVDGTEVYVEGEFAEGETLFVVTAEGNIAAPEGTHETEDGKLISVDANGVITSVEEKPAEEAPAEAEAEFEAEEVVETQTELTEDFLNQIGDLINSKFDELANRINAVNEEFHAFKNEPAASKITNNLGEVQKSEGDLATARFNKLVEFRNQTKK